ncbi:FAD-linked sulfhydryl oxidase ALR [Aethina tumida]|uniref:FAD-linked sulfhydryl oxidase ALR n=1 Tax=Aethina tumida TaxID=116153 RepID=UPI00214857BD|nr:FAD-linked sulfhydryl oxidase ALR [Aethina tumida]
MSRHSTPLDAEPCRSCVSFSDYLKQTKKKIKQDLASGETVQEIPTRNDCPLDKDELGSKTWGLLHTMAARYPEKPSEKQQDDMRTFFKVFSQFYPCDHCAEDFRKDLKSDPPRTESQEALSQWLCKMHNKVNVKTGKDVFDCSKINERWRDGWLDGSCG